MRNCTDSSFQLDDFQQKLTSHLVALRHSKRIRKMKKLIFAAAAVAGMGAFALESANVVGYTEYKTETKKQPSFGACFMPLDGSASYKLKDLVPSNFDADNDMIQVINPSTLATDATYVYFSKEFADAAASEEGEPAGAFDELIGWWNPSYDIGDE